MTNKRKKTGVLGWMLRVVLGLVLVVALAVGGFFAWFTLVKYPQLKAEGARTAVQAAAFAKLTGEARRLAIYDAFCDQIEAHYYDKTFKGMDWKAMRRDWRAKAAAAPDDTRLYTDVLMQMTQRFPTSHVAVLMPPRQVAASSASALPTTQPDMDMDRSMGFQLVQFRRGAATGAVVGDVYPDSAAAKAGIEPGWVIGTVTVNLEPVNGAFTGHVSGTFTAPYTDTQKLGYDRDLRIDVSTPAGGAPLKELRTISVAYDFPFDKPEAGFETRVLPGGARYIRFDEFNAAQMDKVLTAIDQADGHGLILDLRSNHGGEGRERMRLMSRFLPPHTAFESEVRNGRRLSEYTDLLSHRYAGSVVVLIGPESASAAETIPAALQDYHRAVLIGRMTNGSVLGSQNFPLPDGGQVQIPVDDVVTVKGRHLEAVGVVPDIAVMPSLSNIRAGHDPALERAEAELARRL